MSKETYYEETISETNEEHKMGLTVEQIRLLAASVAVSADMWGEYSGHRYIADPRETESERKLRVLEKELKEKDKIIQNATDRMAEKYRVSPSQVSLGNDGVFEIRAR